MTDKLIDFVAITDDNDGRVNLVSINKNQVGLVFDTVDYEKDDLRLNVEHTPGTFDEPDDDDCPADTENAVHTYRITLRARFDDEDSYAINMFRQSTFADHVQFDPVDENCAVVGEIEVIIPIDYKLEYRSEYSEDNNVLNVLLTMSEAVPEKSTETVPETPSDVIESPEKKSESKSDKDDEFERLLDKFRRLYDPLDIFGDAFRRYKFPEYDRYSLWYNSDDKKSKSDVTPYNTYKCEKYWINGKDVTKEQFEKETGHSDFWKDFDKFFSRW